MKTLIFLLCIVLVSGVFPRKSHSFIEKEKMKAISDYCIDKVSGMEKAFTMEWNKIPLETICSTLKKEDLISNEKCLSFFSQKEEAESIVDFKNAKEAYMVLYEACVEMEVEKRN